MRFAVWDLWAVKRRDVDWRVASLLAMGSVLGALLGARLALGPHAAKWVFRLLVAAVLFEVVHLAAGYV